MKCFVKFWQRGIDDIRDTIINPLLGLSYYKKCFLLIALGIGLFVPFMDSYNATHDEQATMLLFGYPWKEMFSLIAIEDGHPPLYHTIYRLFQLGGDIHNVFPLRVATLCIFALTALLGVFPLRRLLGETGALFFIVCVFFLPSALWLSINVRMYSLVLYVVSGTFIYSQLIVFDNKKTDWLFFALFTLAGIYTHYFCCIIFAIVWGIVFVQFLLQKQYKKIACLIGTGFIISLLYLPWIFVFLQQYDNMKTTWFPDTLQRDIAIYGAVFLLRPLGNPILEFLFCFLGVFCWILIWEYLLDKKRDKKIIITQNAVIIFWGLFVSAFLISIFIRPTLSPRFLVVVMGFLYIGVAAALPHFKKFRKIFWWLLSFSYVLGYMHYYTVANDQSVRHFVTEFHQKIPEDSLLVYTDTWSHLFSEFYLPQYDKIYAPLKSYILLFQDRILNDRKNNADLSKYSHIYLLRKSNISLRALKYFADELEYDKNALLYLQSAYALDGMLVLEISREQAENLLRKSEVFLQESIHPVFTFKEIGKTLKCNE